MIACSSRPGRPPGASVPEPGPVLLTRMASRRRQGRSEGTIIHGVIRSYADRATEDVFDGIDSKRARAICPRDLWGIARRKLTQLNRVRDLGELAVPPGNRLERLHGDRTGQWSIRINERYRVCFRWEGGHADDVEIADYH